MRTCAANFLGSSKPFWRYGTLRWGQTLPYPCNVGKLKRKIFKQKLKVDGKKIVDFSLQEKGPVRTDIFYDNIHLHIL